MKLAGKVIQRLIQVSFLVALVLTWQFLTATGAVNTLLLPTVPSVWSQFVKLFASGAYWPDLRVTLYEYVVSMCIFLPLGLAAGYLVSRSRFAVRTFDPLLSALYAIPQIILLPVYTLYFGIGPGSKIAIGVTAGFFPVALNTIAAFASVNSLYIAAAKSMGASGARMFWWVMVPAAWPVVLTGLRIGLIVSFLSILGTETIVSISGLGHRIVSLAELMDTSLMFAYILFAIMIATTLNYIISSAEARGTKH